MGVLEGRTAIVTAGGGIGMGGAVSKALAAAGASVLVADIDGPRAEAVAHEIAAAGGKALPLTVDVMQADQVERMVATAVAELGPVGILINHAGAASGTPIEDMPEDEWDLVVGTNLKGTYLCTRAVAPHMKSQSWGRIVSTVSKAAYRVSNNVMGLTAYAAAKYGIVGFSRAMAMELGPWNITANCIAPGFVENSGMKSPRTGGVVTLTREQQQGAMQNAGQLVQPMEYVTVEEAAAAFLYFVGPAGDRVTGTTIHLNGGSFFGA